MDSLCTQNRSISEQEILVSISNLQNNKTPGPDGLATELLKGTKHKIILPIVLLL